MSLNMIGNKLTDEDVKLLRLEEKRRKLHNLIKITHPQQVKSKGWKDEYKKVKQEIKDIAYDQSGLFDDTRFGHLLDKNNELNLGLLKKRRVENMKNVDELAIDELTENLNNILKLKEYLVFRGLHLEGKSKTEIANKLDISKSYVYTLINDAESKIKDKYNLEKVVERLEEANVSDEEYEPEAELSEDENKAIHDAVGESFESDDPEPEE